MANNTVVSRTESVWFAPYGWRLSDTHRLHFFLVRSRNSWKQCSCGSLQDRNSGDCLSLPLPNALHAMVSAGKRWATGQPADLHSLYLSCALAFPENNTYYASTHVIVSDKETWKKVVCCRFSVRSRIGVPTEKLLLRSVESSDHTMLQRLKQNEQCPQYYTRASENPCTSLQFKKTSGHVNQSTEMVS